MQCLHTDTFRTVFHNATLSGRCVLNWRSGNITCTNCWNGCEL